MSKKSNSKRQLGEHLNSSLLDSNSMDSLTDLKMKLRLDGDVENKLNRLLQRGWIYEHPDDLLILFLFQFFSMIKIYGNSSFASSLLLVAIWEPENGMKASCLLDPAINSILPASFLHAQPMHKSLPHRTDCSLSIYRGLMKYVGIFLCPICFLSGRTHTWKGHRWFHQC